MSVASPPVTFVSLRDEIATVQGGGSQTNPLAATVIASATTTDSGRWEVQAYPFFSGTVAAGDVNNIGVYQGTTLRFTLPLPAVIATEPGQYYTIVLDCAQGDVISLKAIGNASGALAVYSGAVICRKIS
jgi:hypothetical protein